MAFRWNIKKRNFCFQYVRNGGQGAKAYSDAGYGSDRPAEGACRLLKIKEIQDQIDKFNQELLIANGTTEERVKTEVIEMAGIGFDQDHTVFDLFEEVQVEVGITEEGEVATAGTELRLKQLSDIPRSLQKMVKDIKITSTQHGQNVSVTMHDKLRLIELIAKDFGMFEGKAVEVGAEEFAKQVQLYLELMDEADGAVQNETPATD